MPTTDITKVPTVRIETTFLACAICGARRRAAETMDLHFDLHHEDAEEVAYVTKTSEYGQPAGFPVPAGDRVVSA